MHSSTQTPEPDPALAATAAWLPPFLHPLIHGANAFVDAYRSLGNAERAMLRREDPQLCAGYWQCLRAARVTATNAGADNKYLGQLEKCLPLLVPVLDASNWHKGSGGLGAFLRSPRLSARRVEAVLAETDRPGLAQQIDGLIRIAPEQKMDYGVLVAELIYWRINNTTMRRQWARQIFLDEA